MPTDPHVLQQPFAWPFRHGNDLTPDSVDYETAHKLPSCDAFLGYFAKVLALPGLSTDEAKQSCTWSDSEPVDFQYGKDAEWIQKPRTPEEIAARRLEWQNFIRHETIPYSKVKDSFKGRGIVVLTGNGDSFHRAKVILRSLARLKSRMPVEFHYHDDELDDALKEQLRKIYPNCFFNDLAGDHNILATKKGILGVNYHFKTAAMLNSRFAELLLLDSDNIPVLDPATLYESATYKEYGAVFWPDIARTRPENPAWAITNSPCRMDEYEQESGQVLLDKRRLWYHLQLATWINNNKGTYYNQFLLGDKDTFRFAWHALKTKFGKPKKWLTSVGTVNDGYYCGHTFAQHHPDNEKVAFLHGGTAKTVSLEILKWNREERGGYFRQYKRSPYDEYPLNITKLLLKFDTADYKPDHAPDMRTAWCTDMPDVEARNLDEILPGYESIFEEIGGYWQLDGDD